VDLRDVADPDLAEKQKRPLSQPPLSESGE
jgi:hypothetical protein